MAGTFKFELVTPERMALSQDATQVLVPGVEGEFTVLPGHAPVISALRPGVIEVTLAEGGEKERIFVKGGFAEVDADRVTVLAERALAVEQMDAGTIAAELETAEAELAAATDDAARLAAAAAVDRLRAIGR
jgi:F-type H+-transporting ATPase subunit epsilon